MNPTDPQPVFEHEEALIRSFIVPAKRAQYLERLSSPKTRQQFMGRHFHHMQDLDPRYSQRIDPRMPLVEFRERHDAHVRQIHELLRGAGAPETCYVLSASSELDRHEVELHAALEAIVGRCDGSFLSCIPGRLAYFEGEGVNERYVLRR